MDAHKRVGVITGITGQDGSYLSELLLEKNYIVYGMMRRRSMIDTRRLDDLFAHENFRLRYGDVTDMSSVMQLLTEASAEGAARIEFYNLAAQSHVKVSFLNPMYTTDSIVTGTLNCLEAIRCLKLEDRVRFYQASSSEMYGKVRETPQNEQTPFAPCSPYAAAKAQAHYQTQIYRESYGMFACAGILFNHESIRRGETFVTRKISRTVAEDKLLCLGNLDAKRDWGHSRDYVRAMWLMLQQEQADDYVIATGKQYSVREFVELCFRVRGVEIAWRGEGEDEVGVDAEGRVRVRVDRKYFRPNEVETLLGDASKAQGALGWKPTCDIEQLAREMVEGDLLILRK